MHSSNKDQNFIETIIKKYGHVGPIHLFNWLMNKYNILRENIIIS